MNSQKQSQEQLQKKLKADQKELETSRKKQKESIDKMRDDEMNKIKAQKKLLE